VKTRRAARQRGLAGSTLLLVLLAVLIGIAAGIGGYTLVYAEGLSYMSSQYDSWQKSSHHAVAGCVDCHLPHDFIGKWTAKALNGYHHSKGFTLQDFDEPITIKPGNSRILQENCLTCHRDLVHEAAGETRRSEEFTCVHCHQSVGHGDRAGLGGRRL
jgi:cytochrome c nitrite reductase small subunit